MTCLCFISHAVDMWHIYKTGISIYSREATPWLCQSFKIWVFSTYFTWGGVFGISEVRDWIRSRVNLGTMIVILLTLTILTVAFQCGLGNKMTYNSPEYQHDAPIVILWVMSILAVATCYGEKVSKSPFMRVISECTLGVYILHGSVALVCKMVIPATTFENLILIALLTFGLSFLLTIIAMHLPIMKYVVQVPKFKFLK